MKIPLRVLALFLGITGIRTSASLADPAWFWQNPPAQDRGGVLSVATFDAQTAVAVGYYGFILRTNDGGTTWTASGGTSPLGFFGVSFADQNTIFAVGGDAWGGAISRTTDRGATWVSLGPATRNQLR